VIIVFSDQQRPVHIDRNDAMGITGIND